MALDTSDDATAIQPPAEPVARAPRRRAWRRFKWTVRAALLALLAIILIMGCDSWFYYPSRRVHYTPADFGLAYEDVWFSARDGVKLHGWFLPAARRRTASAPAAPRGTVVHFHGNAENITAHILGCYWLPSHGFQVLLFDYRGYGRSAGRVTRAGTILDGHAAIDYALSRPDVDPRRLFAFGQSIGGAVATVVAAERPEIAALVLDAPFSSYRRVAALHARRSITYFDWPAKLLTRALVSQGHDPIDVVARIAPRPLLVIASGRDRVCYPELARELFDAAREPKQFWLVPEAEHLSMLETAGHEAEERIADFFDAAARAD